MFGSWPFTNTDSEQQAADKTNAGNRQKNPKPPRHLQPKKHKQKKKKKQKSKHKKTQTWLSVTFLSNFQWVTFCSLRLEHTHQTVSSLAVPYRYRYCALEKRSKPTRCSYAGRKAFDTDEMQLCRFWKHSPATVFQHEVMMVLTRSGEFHSFWTNKTSMLPLAKRMTRNSHAWPANK